MGALQPSPAQRSPWHSPVPYLFGGLAVMLGLIAFALLILACSYWKFSSYGVDGERDLEVGDEGNGREGSETDAVKPPPVLEKKYLVIMAGQEKPTHLATPMSSRASSFGNKSSCSSSGTTLTSSEGDSEEKKQQINGRQIEMGNVEAHQPPDQFG